MKKQITILFTALIALSAFQTQKEPDGKKLYEANCLRWQGADGNKGFIGAGKLIQSKLDDAATTLIIQNGKRIMPSFKKSLTESEIKSLVTYIKTLRKIKP